MEYNEMQIRDLDMWDSVIHQQSLTLSNSHFLISHLVMKQWDNPRDYYFSNIANIRLCDL